MKQILLYTTFVSLALSACMSLSDLSQNQAFLPPVNIDTSINQALDTPYFSQGCWPNANWWKSLESPELNALIEDALSNNPSIESVRQKVEVAKQMTIKSKSSLFPFLSFNAQEDWEHISKAGVRHAYNPDLGVNVNQIQFDLGFQYEFDFWGKYRNTFKSAKRKALAQVAESKQVELIVSAAISQSFYLLKTNLNKLEFYNQLLLTRQNLYSLSMTLEKHFMLSKIAPATAKQKLDDVKKEITSLNDQIASNKYLINVLRGQSPDAPIGISNCLTNVPQSLSIPTDLSSDLLVQRPDLIASILKVESLAYAKNSAIADFFPRINLRSYAGFDSIGYKHLLNWQSGIMGLLPSFHLPIFKAGEIKANYKVKQAELDEAIYSYNELILKSLQEVSDSLSSITSWYKQREIQENILLNASLKFDLIKQRTEIGIDSFINLNLQKEHLLEKEIDNIQIVYNQYISLIQLIKSLGGGIADQNLQSAIEVK